MGRINRLAVRLVVRRLVGLALSLLVLGCAAGWGSTDAALAAVAPSQQPLDTLQIHLGNQAGGLVFEPKTLTFEAGKRYKLVLNNPSPVKHYFTAKDFTDVIWTQKLEAGQVEVKGAIHELELKPGAAADWVFIPQKPGTYELHCSIPGHAEAGMVGQLTILAGV
ncbi:plastocyanin/azurin family copper-binding protein [Leptothoe sp. PORK10 BA2]|uniref:plastocyanin/azurin family copper-binding protein n=1 Tax=Leptothoe sp. PORK10 BA2 TaxID=3110254 RepID=UPI003FA38D87